MTRRSPPHWVKEIYSGKHAPKHALVRVLEQWNAGEQALTLLYPSRQYQSARSRLFIDFAIDHFTSLPGFAR